MALRRRVLPRSCATEDTVTRELFSETLRELRADLAKQPEADAKGLQRGLSADDIARESLMCTRFTDGFKAEGFCRVHLAPSIIPGAGAGVFAAEDIAEGDIVTFYPGDILTFSRGGCSQASSRSTETRSIIWGAHVPAELRADPPSTWVDYEIGVSEFYTIMGLPSMLDDMAYVGHMVNDGAMLQTSTGGDHPVGASAAYIAHSEKLANAAHIDLAGCHAAVVATRALTAGEEVFVTYGVQYWASREIRLVELAGDADKLGGIDPGERAAPDEVGVGSPALLVGDSRRGEGAPSARREERRRQKRKRKKTTRAGKSPRGSGGFGRGG